VCACVGVCMCIYIRLYVYVIVCLSMHFSNKLLLQFVLILSYCFSLL